MKSQTMRLFTLFGLMLSASLMPVMSVQAATVLDVLTDTQDRYSGPTVEDNVMSMDTDKNGFADATEVRAFLELKHGKGYESEILERFEASLKSPSCATPFAGKLQLVN